MTGEEPCYGCLCGCVHACEPPCYYYCPPCVIALGEMFEETELDWQFERILTASDLPFDWCGGPRV